MSPTRSAIQCKFYDESRDEAIEMLAQHLITAPVFEALFDGYDFKTHNPACPEHPGVVVFHRLTISLDFEHLFE